MVAKQWKSSGHALWNIGGCGASLSTEPEMEKRRKLTRILVWLTGPRNDFIASMLVYLHLIERGHLRSTPLSAAMHLAHCSKHLWNSCWERAFSAVITVSWMSSLSWYFHPFKANFVYGNNQKSFGAKLGE